MANTKIDRIKLSTSDTTYDIDLPTDATPTISSLTTDTLSVTGTSTLSDVDLGGTISGGTISGATISGGTVNNANLSACTISGGTIQASTILTNSGVISGGTISGSTLADCTISDGTELVNGGTILAGTIKDSTLSNCRVGTTLLTTKTKYTAQGSATEIPIITTNSLGQVTTISTTTVQRGHRFIATFTGTSRGVTLQFDAYTSTGDVVTQEVVVQNGRRYASPADTVFLIISRSATSLQNLGYTVGSETGLMVSLDDPTRYDPANILGNVATQGVSHHCLLLSDCMVSLFNLRVIAG